MSCRCSNTFHVRNWSPIATHVLVVGRLLHKSHCFKLDRDEIWQDCSPSKYALTDWVGFRIWYHSFKMAAVTSCHEKAYGSVVSKRIRMKFGTNVLHDYVHQLTESDFWFDVKIWRWRHDSSAVQPPSEWKWNGCCTNMQQARQFLICSTFVLVFQKKRTDVDTRIH